MMIILHLRALLAGGRRLTCQLLPILLLVCAIPIAHADTNVGGTISTDTTWTVAGSPYIVTANITVKGTDGADGITTLTIEPGVEVRFNRYQTMTIGASSGDPGALAAQGTTAEPIMFTSNEASPAAGDWYNLYFQNTTDDASTVLEHCIVEYSGYNQGALYVYNASPTIRNTQIRHNKNKGIYINGGQPTIDTCQLSDNVDYDLYYSGTVGGSVSNSTINNGINLAATGSVAFSGNTINQNNAFPIIAKANQVGGIVSGNTITNVDSASYLQVNAETISSDATWDSQIPYYISGSTTVKGTDGADGITTLTLLPGVQLKFKKYTQMTIGASSGDPGALVAQGATADPIVFTSNEANPTVGDWYNLYFQNTTDDASTVLEHCIVEYSGYNQGALYVYNASPTIRNTQIRHNKNKGIYINGGQPTIDTCQLSDNVDYDLYYSGTVGGSVSNSTINNGIYLAATGSVAFSGNTINQNNAFPIIAKANQVGGIVSGNTITNVDSASYLQVNAETISSDATWDSQIPYYISGSTTVKGTDGADGITTLTLLPGVQLRFKKYTNLTIGASSGDPGALVAQGTTAEPIVFTSNEANPTAGDWYYLYFQNTTDDTSTIIEQCVVEYSGYSQGALYLNNASPKVRNSTIRYSKNAGIYGSGSGSENAEVNCNTFTGNKRGIHWATSPAPEMHNNNLTGNTEYGLYYSGAASLNAEDNWWGHTAGPNAGGDATYGNIDSEPWSGAEQDCSGGGTTNIAPNAPTAPSPPDDAVRVAATPNVQLSWNCSDPNSGDTLTYDLYWGTSAASLQIQAQAVSEPIYPIPGLLSGTTYYWQVIAHDNGGLSTAGPIWRFTTTGDPPDLIVTAVGSIPAGGMQENTWVTLTAEVSNIGSGPVVDGFLTQLLVNGSSASTVSTDILIPMGGIIQLTYNWIYTGGDPLITVTVDSQNTVAEINESNNQWQGNLSAIADISPPQIIAQTPTAGAQIQPVDQISVTLSDNQSAIDDTVVQSSFIVVDSTQQSIAGQISEVNDTFLFVPTNLPLADGPYEVSVTAADSYGNSAGYSFSFTIDSQPPAKPVITGGVVASGTIQARPVQNSADRLITDLEGTRANDSSVWINGLQCLPIGSGSWSCQINLSSGDNALEIYCRDVAGNQSASEWVDIRLDANGGIVYEYDASGRMKAVISKEN